METKATSKPGFKAFLTEALRDRSLAALLLANAFAIVLAVIERWDLAEVMRIYWTQNLIIGFFHFLKILTLKRFSTAGLVVDGRPVPEGSVKRIPIAFFFLFHYGFFHFVYASFLSSGFVTGRPAAPPVSAEPSADLLFTAVSILVFFANHLFSFFYDRKRDAGLKPKLATVIFFPYARIIPMHLTIILGGFLAGAAGPGAAPAVLVLFLVLKTIADVLMQAIEQRALRRGAATVETTGAP